MIHWLADESWLLIGLLTVAAVGFMLVWYRKRKRGLLLGAGVCLAGMILLALLGSLVETDRQQIVNKLHVMAAAVKTRQISTIFEHVSDRFRFNTHNKAEFRKRVEAVIAHREVQELAVWDEELLEASRESRRARLTFNAKPKGPWGEVHYLVRSVWVLEADNQWRLESFEVFNPFVNTDSPLQVPGF